MAKTTCHCQVGVAGMVFVELKLTEHWFPRWG
jgi:hypothetical protein